MLNCTNCGKPMNAKRSTKRFCSATCRKEWFHKHQPNEDQAKQIESLERYNNELEAENGVLRDKIKQFEQKAAELQRHNANVINAIIIWRIEKSKMGPYWEMKGYSFEDKLIYPRPIMIHDMNTNMKKAISPLVFKVAHSKRAVMS